MNNRNNVGNISDSREQGDNIKFESLFKIPNEAHDYGHLRKSNTANSLLGLSVVLNGNRKEYDRSPVSNLALNNYFGFKAI